MPARGALEFVFWLALLRWAADRAEARAARAEEQARYDREFRELVSHYG